MNLLRRAKTTCYPHDLLKYNANTIMATIEEGTMLICPSDFEQFGQGVSEKPT
jgi:hypothetical protein